jgi:SM-20-related protein
MDQYGAIIDAIAERGWSVTGQFLPVPNLEALIREEEALWEEGQFRMAGVDVGANRTVRPEIRSDRVLWIDPEHLTPALAAYWEAMDILRQRLNREFFLGLQDFEAHFAVYPPGSFYKRHLDQFKEVRHRRISCILYLNKDWQPEHGGRLRIYEDAGEGEESYTDVLPEYGTFVCFRSDTVYHEVLPATRERFSLTGWLRTR